MRMRQVIKHRDIRLLNMIRRTDPVIPRTDPVIPNSVEKLNLRHEMFLFR